MRNVQISAHIFLAAFLFLIISAGYASADCLSLLRGNVVSVEDTGTVRALKAGIASQLKWRLSKATEKLKKCPGRLVVEFSFDGVVRFGGDGYIAVTPGARGLYGITEAAGSTRAFFSYPLDQLPKKITAFPVKFWSVGSTRIKVAAFYVRSRDTETTYYDRVQDLQDVMRVDVAIGAPVLSAQDRFDTKAPINSTPSANGRYVLKDYGEYFRVFSSSGSLLLVSRGRLTSFSAQGDFVSTLLEGGLDIFDLRSGTLAYRLRLNGGTRDFQITAVAWAENDSFMVMSLGGQGALLVKPLLMDDVEKRSMHATLGPEARYQEPGHASDVIVDLGRNHYATSYSWQELTAAAGDPAYFTGATGASGTAMDAFEPEMGSHPFLRPAKVTAVGDWNKLNWSADHGLTVTTDLSSAGSAGLAALPAATSGVATTASNSAHQFYMHRPGGPLYIRYRALFQKRNPISWLRTAPQALIAFIEQNGLELEENRPLRKMFSLNANEIADIDWGDRPDIFPMLPVSGKTSGPLEDFEQNAAPIAPLIENLAPMIKNEREVYNQHYEMPESGEVGLADDDSQIVFFPNNVSDEIKTESATAFLHRLGVSKISEDVLFVGHDQDALTEDEQKRLAATEEDTIFDCIGADGAIERIAPYFVRDVWLLRQPGRKIWVVQSSCTGGLRGDWIFGQVLILQVNDDGTFTKNIVGNSLCNEGKSRCNFLSADVASLRVDVAGKSTLLLQGYNDTLITYDLDSAKVVSEIDRSDQGVGAYSTLSKNGKFVLMLQQDGSFELIASTSGKTALSGIVLDDEVVIYNSDGRFSSTEDGASFVKVKFAGVSDLQSLKQFRRALFSPDILKRLDSGVPISDQRLSDLPLPPQLSLHVRTIDNNNVSVMITAPPYETPSQILLFADGAKQDLIVVPKAGISLERPMIGQSMEAVRVADNGAESTVSSARATSLPTVPRGKLYVLSVGVSDFFDPRISDLQFASSDATRICRSALQGLGRYTASIDLSEDCDPQLYPSTEAALESTAVSMTASDTLVIFVSTHGVRGSDGEYYLLRQDTNIDALPQTALKWSSIVKTLSSSSGRIFLFLDACHSGQAGRLLQNDDLVSSINVSTESSVFVIAASKGRQKSWFSQELKAGYFANTLNEILLEPAASQRLEFNDLYQALKAKVVALTAGRQTPWLSSSFPLSNVSLN